MLLSHLKAKQCHDATVIKLMHMWDTMAEVCVGSEYTEVEVISTYKWHGDWYHAEHKHNTLTSGKI